MPIFIFSQISFCGTHPLASAAVSASHSRAKESDEVPCPPYTKSTVRIAHPPTLFSTIIIHIFHPNA
ncbi:hypothetical protein JHK85_047267 [Glycine max]|nr:hypothetical protein JHK85_047267 [Glycine max]KHN17526.1 hypothetical protein glysoja_005723 [Glycine soja]